MRGLRRIILLASLIAAGPAVSAQDRMTTIARETFACTSWAGWRGILQAPTPMAATKGCTIQSASLDP